MKPLEVLHRPFQHGAATLATSKSNVSQPFAGRATISSGSATVTVSTSVVGSDSMVFLSPEFNTAITSLFGLRVSTISPGVSFTVATTNGAAVDPAQDVEVMWELKLA